MRAYFLATIFIFSLVSCTRETEDYVTEPLSDYVPLQTGKYITYRVDSTVFPNFGRSVEIHSYQEKNIVDAQISDASGRSSYRIMRFIRAVNAATGDPWKPSGSYMITSLNNTIEVVENNLRFVKLVQPLKLGYTWKGNNYLPASPYPQYNFTNDDQMYLWDYSYIASNESISLGSKTFSNVLTVEAIRDSSNVPITAQGAFAYKNVAVDKYAKGLGLIFQELTIWDYQPPANGNSGYQNGFGVVRSIIDYN